MGVKVTGKYLGGLRMEMTHEDSGATICTVAPKDNNGDGTLFSPTDLFATSLGACVLTVIGIVADRDGVDLSGAHFALEKIMSANPRRVGEIRLSIHLPGSLAPEQRKKLENAGKTCPVHHSLHPDIIADIRYLYDVA